MDFHIAKKLAQYRLFRPLAFKSPHYHSYPEDQELLPTILKWTSKIKLGGHYYDLRVKGHDVFQIHSNVKNRNAYFVFIWDPELVREIVIRSNNKTRSLERGCGLGELKSLEYGGAILVLTRRLVWGSEEYLEAHASTTEWFVEDRYHLEVFVNNPSDKPKKEKGEQEERCLPCEERNGAVPNRKEVAGLPQQRTIRVFHDSAGCSTIPWVSPQENVDDHNQSVWEGLNEYFPGPDEVIMTWHEVAYLLGYGKRGIYALANITAALEQKLFPPYITNCAVYGEYTASGVWKRVVMNPTGQQPYQPLSEDLARDYEQFRVKAYSLFLINPPFVPINPSLRSKTLPPEGTLGKVIIGYLQKGLGTKENYLGGGLFKMKHTHGGVLAAGTGQFGSAEQAGIGISVTENSSLPSESSTSPNEVDGRGVFGADRGSDRVRQGRRGQGADPGVQGDRQRCRVPGVRRRGRGRYSRRAEHGYRRHRSDRGRRRVHHRGDIRPGLGVRAYPPGGRSFSGASDQSTHEQSWVRERAVLWPARHSTNRWRHAWWSRAWRGHGRRGEEERDRKERQMRKRGGVCRDVRGDDPVRRRCVGRPDMRRT